MSTNVQRLKALKSRVHDLGYFAIASNSGGHEALSALLDNQLVRGRPRIFNKLKKALIGENNQKLALDAPTRFQEIMVEAESIIDHEINREIRNLKKLQKEEDDRNER